MTHQLELAFAPRRQRPRELTPLERLHAVLRRRGIDPEWRKRPGHVGRLRILPFVGLDPGARLRTEPRSEHTGLPVQGCWETLCDFCVSCAQRCPDDRYAYNERPGGADRWPA